MVEQANESIYKGMSKGQIKKMKEKLKKEKEAAEKEAALKEALGEAEEENKEGQ